jgi:hypothetical protein
MQSRSYRRHMQVISFWAPNFATQRALWFSSVANTNLWFTFAKAIYSVLKGKFLNRCGAGRCCILQTR